MTLSCAGLLWSLYLSSTSVSLPISLSLSDWSLLNYPITQLCSLPQSQADPHKGKFLAVGSKLDQFLSSYFNTVTLANRRMYLAESYNGQPFK